MPKARLSIGIHYVFQILDHSMCTGDVLAPAICEVMGKLVKRDRYCYYLATWICENALDQNTEVFAIVRSTIVKTRRLK